MLRVIILLSLLLIISCQNNPPALNSKMGKFQVSDQALALEEEMEMEAPRTAEPLQQQEYKLDKGSKVIKNGFMRFEVTDLESAKSKVDTILSACKGFYDNEQYNSYGNRISYTLKLRIPNSKFDSLIRVLEQGMGELDSKNITAKDVTEEFVDLKIRLENNLAYLSQYKEILKKARSVKDVLQVQEKIRRIEEEIESKKGRIKYLEDKVRYSTLNLELTELISKELANRPNFGRRIINAFNNGVQLFLNIVVGLISLWPLLILALLLMVAGKSVISRFRKKK